MQEAEYTHHKLANIRSINHRTLQMHVLLLAQFHYRDAAEVTIAIADSRIIIAIFELSILLLSPSVNCDLISGLLQSRNVCRSHDCLYVDKIIMLKIPQSLSPT